MSLPVARPPAGAPAGRRSGSTGGRCPRRPLPPGGQRPSDVLVRFLLNAVGYLALAAASGVVSALGDDQRWHWLALHLAFVGAISLMVVGAAQFFATAFLMTTPPTRKLVRAQLATWNAGTILVAYGYTQAHPRLTEAGAGLLVAGLALFALSLRGLTRRSLQRSHWAVRWYLACAAFLAVGAVAGAALATGHWIDGGSLLGAHIALNVGGWFGTAIVGTLHTFYPSLTHTQLRHPRLQAPTFAAWCAGAVLLAAGYGIGVGAVVALGWVALLVAGGMLAVNLVASRRAATDLRLPARLIGAAQPFLVAGLAVGFVDALRHGELAPVAGDARTTLAYLLLAGWVGMTVSGSLLHLMMVLARVRTPGRALPAPTVARDVAVTVLAVAAVAAGALARSAGPEALLGPARVGLVAAAGAVAALIAAEIAEVVRSLRRPARPARRS